MILGVTTPIIGVVAQRENPFSVVTEPPSPHPDLEAVPRPPQGDVSDTGLLRLGVHLVLGACPLLEQPSQKRLSDGELAALAALRELGEQLICGVRRRTVPADAGGVISRHN